MSRKEQNKYHDEGIQPGSNKTSHPHRGNLGNGSQKQGLVFLRGGHPFPFLLHLSHGLMSDLCVCVWTEDEEDERLEDGEVEGLGG